MSDVRPPVWPAAQPVTPRPAAGGAVQGGRAAFFQAALTKAGPPAGPAIQPPTTTETRAPQKIAEPPPTARAAYAVRPEPVAIPDEPPKKIPRPGSIVDIRV